MTQGTKQEKTQHPVETKLSELQECNRLGIHVWEEHSSGDFPDYSWEGIGALDATDIDENLRRGKRPLLSMSLLPKTSSGRAMRPFGVDPFDDHQLAYLVNLDQTMERPARVVRVSGKNLSSGSNIHYKNLSLWSETGYEEVDEIYKKFEDPKYLLEEATGPGAQAFGERQLDALGRYSETRARNFYPNGLHPQVIEHNEILVAAGKEHISALAIPSYGDRSPEQLQKQKFLGALAGLQHLEKGLDLPLMVYHIDPPHQGECVMMAQGKKEFVSLILEAMKDWERKGEYIAYHYEHYECDSIQEHILRLTGLDVKRPLSEQHAALHLLSKEANTAKIEKSGSPASESAGLGFHTVRLEEALEQSGAQVQL